MNERIKEFAKECTEWVTGTIDGDYEYFDKEKFALSLIKECMFAVENHGGMCGATSSKKIKDHFGI